MRFVPSLVVAVLAVVLCFRTTVAVVPGCADNGFAQPGVYKMDNHLSFLFQSDNQFRAPMAYDHVEINSGSTVQVRDGIEVHVDSVDLRGGRLTLESGRLVISAVAGETQRCGQDYDTSMSIQFSDDIVPVGMTVDEFIGSWADAFMQDDVNSVASDDYVVKSVVAVGLDGNGNYIYNVTLVMDKDLADTIMDHHLRYDVFEAVGSATDVGTALYANATFKVPGSTYFELGFSEFDSSYADLDAFMAAIPGLLDADIGSPYVEADYTVVSGDVALDTGYNVFMETSPALALLINQLILEGDTSGNFLGATTDATFTSYLDEYTLDVLIDWTYITETTSYTDINDYLEDFPQLLIDVIGWGNVDELSVDDLTLVDNGDGTYSVSLTSPSSSLLQAVDEALSAGQMEGVVKDFIYQGGITVDVANTGYDNIDDFLDSLPALLAGLSDTTGDDATDYGVVSVVMNPDGTYNVIWGTDLEEQFLELVEKLASGCGSGPDCGPGGDGVADGLAGVDVTFDYEFDINVDLDAAKFDTIQDFMADFLPSGLANALGITEEELETYEIQIVQNPDGTYTVTIGTDNADVAGLINALFSSGDIADFYDGVTMEWTYSVSALVDINAAGYNNIDAFMAAFPGLIATETPSVNDTAGDYGVFGEVSLGGKEYTVIVGTNSEALFNELLELLRDETITGVAINYAFCTDFQVDLRQNSDYSDIDAYVAAFMAEINAELTSGSVGTYTAELNADGVTHTVNICADTAEARAEMIDDQLTGAVDFAGAALEFAVLDDFVVDLTGTAFAPDDIEGFLDFFTATLLQELDGTDAYFGIVDFVQNSDGTYGIVVGSDSRETSDLIKTLIDSGLFGSSVEGKEYLYQLDLPIQWADVVKQYDDPAMLARLLPAILKNMTRGNDQKDDIGVMRFTDTLGDGTVYTYRIGTDDEEVYLDLLFALANHIDGGEADGAFGENFGPVEVVIADPENPPPGQPGKGAPPICMYFTLDGRLANQDAKAASEVEGYAADFPALNVEAYTLSPDMKDADTLVTAFDYYDTKKGSKTPGVSLTFHVYDALHSGSIFDWNNDLPYAVNKTIAGGVVSTRYCDIGIKLSFPADITEEEIRNNLIADILALTVGPPEDTEGNWQIVGIFQNEDGSWEVVVGTKDPLFSGQLMNALGNPPAVLLGVENPQVDVQAGDNIVEVSVDGAAHPDLQLCYDLPAEEVQQCVEDYWENWKNTLESEAGTGNLRLLYIVQNSDGTWTLLFEAESADDADLAVAVLNDPNSQSGSTVVNVDRNPRDNSSLLNNGVDPSAGDSEGLPLMAIIGVASVILFLLLLIAWYIVHKRVQEQYKAKAQHNTVVVIKNGKVDGFETNTSSDSSKDDDDDDDNSSIEIKTNIGSFSSSGGVVEKDIVSSFVVPDVADEVLSVDADSVVSVNTARHDMSSSDPSFSGNEEDIGPLSDFSHRSITGVVDARPSHVVLASSSVKGKLMGNTGRAKFMKEGLFRVETSLKNDLMDIEARMNQISSEETISGSDMEFSSVESFEVEE